MKTPIRAIFAPIFVTGVAMTFVACGKGTGGSTAIKPAPPTEASAKIATCVSTKLSAQGKTFQGGESKVCRLVEGKMKDETVTTLFSAAKKGKQIAIYQRAVFTVAYRNVDGDVIPVKEVPERSQAAHVNEIYVFLNKVCRPLAKKVFTRSHLAAYVDFQYKTADAAWAQPTIPGATDNTTVDDISDEGFGGRAGASPAAESELVGAVPVVVKNGAPQPPAPPTKRAGPARFSMPAGFHAQLDFDILVDGKTKQIKLADEVGALSSGSIVVLQTPSEEQQRFCNQIIQRVGENFGITKGRDCVSRDTAAKTVNDSEWAPGEVKAGAGTGVMKPGSSQSTEAMKVSEEEMLEVVKPVCGST